MRRGPGLVGDARQALQAPGSVDDTGVIGWARLLPWKQRGFDVVECSSTSTRDHGQGIGTALLNS